jgi:hypothetical protein
VSLTIKSKRNLESAYSERSLLTDVADCHLQTLKIAIAFHASAESNTLSPQPVDTPIVEKPPILGRSVVAMVQPTQASPRNHLTTTDRPVPMPRCSFTQPEVGAVVVVVREVIGEESFQVSLVQRNGLVEQFASAASHPALRDSVLPGLCTEVGTQEIFMDRIAVGTSNPYFASWSEMRNLGVDS